MYCRVSENLDDYKTDQLGATLKFIRTDVVEVVVANNDLIQTYGVPR